MIVLAIDVGTVTGWATAVNGKLQEFGHEDFTPGRGESAGMRFLRFRRWLHRMMPAAERDCLVLFERPNHRGGAATEVLVGLSTRVQEVAEEQGWDCSSVHLNALKKYATGNGHASKEDMAAAARGFWPELADRLGERKLTDDEADALCLLRWGTDKETGETGFLAEQPS